MILYNENEQQKMQMPQNLEYREFPTNKDSAILEMIDAPWYPPYPVDVSHYHNCLEIGVCISGSGTVEMPHFKHEFSKGTITLVPKLVHHAQHNAGQPCTHWYYLAVNIEKLMAEAPHSISEVIHEALKTIWRNGLFIDGEDTDGKLPFTLVQTMFDIKRRYKDAAMPELEAYLLLLLVWLSRKKDFFDFHTFKQDRGSLSIAPAISYVAAHYTEDINVEQLAKSCAMSESHFRRIFLKEVGFSPNAYINRYRIHRATILLRDTTDTVQNVALKVGYSSLDTFNRNYLRYVGQTPSQSRHEE